MNNSFSVFLNIVLAFLFAGSLVFSLFFGNFGGISLKDLNSQYLLKKELSFKDLPKEVQSRYINKDIVNTKNQNTKVVKLFDDEGNPLVEDTDELRELAITLQNRVAYLERENIIVSTQKSELLKTIEQEKSKSNVNQKTLLSKNLEKINEAEQQHYKNISELTRKINDLQRENIALSQLLNQKDDNAKDKIIAIKKQIEDEKKLAMQREMELENIYKRKSVKLRNENAILNAQFKKLNTALQSQRSTASLELNRKDQKITQLQNKINEMMIEKNALLTKNSQAILKIENDNSKKLQEFNSMIKNSNSEKEAIREEYKKTIKRVEDKQKRILKEQKNEIEELMQKLEHEKQNSVTMLANSEKVLLENKKINIDKMTKLKNKIEELSGQIATFDKNEKKVKSQLKTSQVALTLSRDKVLQLQDKIKELELGERAVDDEVDELVKANEAKHNKNYKILNEKIAMLELDMQSMQNTNAKVLSSLSNEKTELINKLSNSLQQNSKKENQIKTLQEDIQSIEKKKNDLELSENEKLTKIRKSFDELKISMELREKKLSEELTQKSKELQKREKNREKLGKYIREITSLKKTLKEMQSNKKAAKASSALRQLGKVECGDMTSGNFKISSTCKAKVDTFLSQYDETHYFEVIPLVGAGGFASLNKVQRDGSLGISDNEIQRLTRLANIGLGRDRAKEGGWLIRDKFGDDVKISYTVYSIESKNKRGFVIRAYK